MDILAKDTFKTLLYGYQYIARASNEGSNPTTKRNLRFPKASYWGFDLFQETQKPNYLPHQTHMALTDDLKLSSLLKRRLLIILLAELCSAQLWQVHFYVKAHVNNNSLIPCFEWKGVL